MSCASDLAKCDASYLALKRILKDAERKLIACQAREKVLREMFDNLLNGLRANFALSPEGRVYLKHVDEFFGAPDDTALKAALAAERERCAKACKQGTKMTVLEDTRDEDSTEVLTSGWDTDWDSVQPPDAEDFE